MKLTVVNVLSHFDATNEFDLKSRNLLDLTPEDLFKIGTETDTDKKTNRKLQCSAPPSRPSSFRCYAAGSWTGLAQWAVLMLVGRH